MLGSLQLNYQKPTVKEFGDIRSSANWDNPDDSNLEKSIQNTLHWVCARSNQKLVGIGRVIGDGAMYFYIQDVIVEPLYQGQGIGRLLMENIETFLSQHCPKHATIGLFAAQGKETFYSKYRYLVRNGDPLGHGMCRFV